MNQYLNERCSKILKILMDEKQPITISEISQKLNVSDRTIRYDLEELNDILSQYDGAKIEKKARVGIWLECRDSSLDEVQNLLYKNKTYIKPLSSDERKYYIIKQLIQAPDIIKMQNLANDLYVSRITIHNDLKDVENWLNKFDLKLIKKQNYGLQISGQEKNWRKASSVLLTILKDSEELKSVISEAEELNYESRMNYKSFKQIQELIPEIDLRLIETILNEAEKIFNMSLTDEAFEGLVVHIAISIRRINSNNAVELKQEQLSAIKEAEECRIGEWIINRIKCEIDINFSESEIAYLTLHILGSKLHENVQMRTNSKIIGSIDEKLKMFTKEIISLISSILGYDLSNDERFYNGLILHLRPTINRMTYGLNLRNPLINEIKNKFPAIFGAAWATSTLFEKHYNIKVTEEEIGYIALHVGAAIERINTNIKAAIVCGSGIGTSELVAARLSRQISDITVVGTLSLNELKTADKDSFDILITTVPIGKAPTYNKPVIQISPLTTNEDISKIKKIVKDVESSKRTSVLHKAESINQGQELFYKDLIFVKERAASKNEIITNLSRMLINKGFVSEEFTDSVIERENLTSTAISNGVALPHGGEAFVKHSCIVIASLENPLDWGGAEIDIIFLLALKLEDRNYIRRFFSYFYSVLDDDNMLNKIRESTSSGEVLDLISDFK
ncbi:MAG: BglG family transcription antiterminator [Clostridiaceae bacterium]